MSDIYEGSIPLDDIQFQYPASALYRIGEKIGYVLIDRYFPTPCPACGGTGEAEGIGGRLTPCGDCGATGKIYGATE
jgi:hypothetical protein